MATYEEIKKKAEKVNSYNKGVGTNIPTFKQYVNNGAKDLIKTINATGQSIADSFARVGNGMIDTFEGILDFTQQSYLMVKNSKNIIDLERNLSGRGTWDIETQKQIQSIKDNDFIRNQFNLASKKEMLNDVNNSYLQTTKVGNLVGSALEGVGQTLPMIAVSTATGGLYLLGASKQIVDTANAIVKNANLIGIGLSSAGQSVNEAVDSGADFGKAYKYGLVKGAIESATETIGGESITNKVPTMFKTNKNASLVQRLLKDVSAEGIEEVISDLADPFAKSIYQKESLKAFKDVDYYKGLGESFLVGSLSSLMSSGVALTDKNTRITNLVDTQMALAENYNKTNDTIEREKIIKQITNNNESISKLVQSLDDVSKETYIIELGKIGINLNEDGTVIKNDKFIKSDYVSLNANSDIVTNQMERIDKKLKTKVSITTEMNETQKENYNKFQNLMENRNQQTGNQVDYVVLDNMGNAHGGIVGNTIYIAKEDFNDDTWKYTSTHEWEHFTEDTEVKQDVKLGDFRKNTKTEITQREVNTESRSNLLYEIDKTQFNNGVLNEKGKQTIDSMIIRNYISKQEGEMLKNGTAEEITKAFNDKKSFAKEFYAVASEKLLSNDNYINKLVRGDKTLLNKVLNKIEDLSLKSKIGTEEYKTFKSIEKAFNKALESKGYKYQNRKIISSSDKPEFNLKTWRDKTILVGDKYYSGKEILTDTLNKENWTLSNIKTMIEDNLTGQDGFDDVRFSYKDINFDDIQKEHSRQDKIITKSQVEEFLYNQFKKEGYLFSHKKAMDMAEYIARAYNGSRTSTEYQKIVDRIVDSYLDAIKWATADKNGNLKQEDYLDLTEDDIKYIKEIVGQRIAENFKFKDTKKSELIDNYNRFINEMKADYQEIIERQKYASLCEQSARRLKDMKYGAFQNATKYKDVDFQKAIFNLSKISFRGNFNESGTRKLIKELSDWYVLDNPIISPSFDQQDKTIGANWNEEIANIMEDIAVGDGRITNEELQNIAKVLDYFKRFIETYNKIWRNGRLVDATEYGNNYLKIAKYSQEHARDNIYNKFERAKLTTSYNELFNDPMSLARRYDAYKDGFLTNTMNEFREASINIGLMEMRLREELDKFLEKYDKGLSNTYIDRLFKTNITVNENEMPLNVGLSLYLTMAQYDSWDGLLLSGFDWYDEDNNRHDVKPLASELQDKLALGQDITDEDKLEVIRKLVQEIKSQLTPEDKEYIKIVSRTFNDKCKEEKRKTDMFVNGYSNVRDGFYYPLARANVYKSIDSDSYISEVDRVSSKSFNKERVSNKNRLVISAVNKVFDKHIRGISQYCNLTMPIQNFNRLYNMPLESSQYSNKVSLKREIELVWKNADTYLNTLLDDIQGKTTSEDSIKSKTSNVLNSLRGHTAVFQLGANPKVLATQWSSLLASTNILDYNSIIKGLNIKVSDSEVEKYCELAQLRAYDKTIIKAESVTDKVSKIGEKLMGGISWMDRQVVKTLYGACQVEVKTKYNLEIGTEDNKVKAGELLKQVILETQQNAFATDRSSAMRSNNQLNKTLTMYTADAMKCYGRFIDALGEYSMVKNNGTVEEVNKAKKKVFKSLGAVTTNSIFQALIGLLFNHLLAKDDEEDIKSVLADIGGNMIGALPVAKEVYNFFTNGYEINDSNMSLINDMLSNGKNFAKIIFSGEGEKVPYILKSIVDTIGRFTGIPTRNIYNYTTGLIRRFSEKSGYIIDDFFYTKKYNSDLVKYAEEDNQDMLEVIYCQILKEKTSSTSKAVSEELARLYSSGYKVSISDATYKENVDTMIKYESYAKLSDEHKYKAINYLYNMSDKNKLFSKVISPEKLAVIYGYTYNLKSDEKSTKKEKVTSYVSKLKLSAVEKYIVMGMLGYKNSNGKDQVESYIKKLGLNKEERTLLLEYCGYEN